VPNLTIGPVVVKWIRPVTRLPLDVHLMIQRPWEYVEPFRKAGADWITVHVETGRLPETLRMIRRLGAKAGISLKPKTPLKAIRPYLKDADLALIMTVEPGFGGQAFLPDELSKIEDLRKIYKGLISVDGGINGMTGAECAARGADILVAGTAVFGRKDRARAIRELRAGRGNKKIFGY
jgi:ribulose-phosphate 3-epimerase